jgi:hypothetical protein
MIEMTDLSVRFGKSGATHERQAMNDRCAARRRAGPGVGLLLIMAAALTGCTGMTGAVSEAFVDPSLYDLYDCDQLATERASLTTRLAENQRLIDKARTGAAGDAVAELAYGNTDLSLRGQVRLVERMWAKNRCEGTVAPVRPQASARQR